MVTSRILEPLGLEHTIWPGTSPAIPSRTVDAELEQFWPGARDGLGLFSRPLPCGGVYWGHSGDQTGYMTRVGATPDGRRSVVVSVSTQMSDSLEHVLEVDGAANELVARALCGPHG